MPFPRKEGLSRKRTITDPACYAFFWVLFSLMVVCVVWGLFYGQITRLTHGSDWEGNLCGIDPVVADKKFMMFCGSPEREGAFPKFIIDGSTVCVPECPTLATAKTMQVDCLMPAFHNFTTYKSGTIGKLANVETLDMTLTQSVTTQLAYPTEAFGGRFCLPSEDNPALRDMIIMGPWGKTYGPMVRIGGLVDAWPLFLIAAGIAALLGLLYVWLLQKYAGVLIFLTMILTTLLTLALGIFFFFAVLMDMDDTTTVYAKFNPIMSVFIGTEAKMYSVITGVIMILVSVLFAAITATSIPHIDEMIGLINATCEALSTNFTLQMYPLMQGGAFVILFGVFFFVGLPIVMSIGALDFTEIEVNGEGVEGLQRIWKRNWLQQRMVWFFAFGLVFLMEIYLQMGHYIVAYFTATWYFTKGTPKPVDNNKVVQKGIGQGFGKKVEVRVAGIDPNYGPRQGSVVMTNAGKMLVVPVGRKGPGLGRNDMELTTFVKDPVPCGTLTWALLSCVFYHMGSLAAGAPIIFFLRPFRILGKFMHHFTHKTADPPRHWNDHKPDHRPPDAQVRHCVSLISNFFDQVFGRFCKDAFTEIVLDGSSDFVSSAFTSFEFLIKSGGSIAHLHGAMMMFELFGCMFITIFVTWTCLIVQDKADMFSEKGQSYYIEDKNASAIACALIAFAIAHAFMSTWNQVADVLLYCVAWNRKQLHEGEVHKFSHDQIIGNVNTFCPQHLRYLMPAHEREAEHEHGLKSAQGMGHAMQILATMEHGIMQTLAGGGGEGDD